MVDVFISYSRANRLCVEPIKHELDALGLDCFFDLHQIDGGANFPDVIDRALRASRVVLCCWSPEYFKGQWSMIECRDAIARGIIVPVAVQRFDQFEPPADLRQINWFDLVGWTGDEGAEEWVRTLRNLERFVGRELVAPMQRPMKAGGASPSDPLMDLRATWEAFPARSSDAAVARFLERVRAIAAGSGLELEVEHHLERLREAAARRAGQAARAAAERRRREEAEELARIAARQARRQAGSAWRDSIPGMPDQTLPEMVTIDPAQCPGARADGKQAPNHVYAVGTRLVTFAQLDAAIAVGADLEWPPGRGAERAARPALMVSPKGAKAYAAWLNQRLGLTGQPDCYRLPTQSELACARSTDYLRSIADDADNVPEFVDGQEDDGAAQASDFAFRLARTLSA